MSARPAKPAPRLATRRPRVGAKGRHALRFAYAAGLASLVYIPGLGGRADFEVLVGIMIPVKAKATLPLTGAQLDALSELAGYHGHKPARRLRISVAIEEL